MKKFLVAAIGLGLVLSTVSPILAQDTAPKKEKKKKEKKPKKT